MPLGTPGIAFPAFHADRNVRAQPRWSSPADAAGPVYGPSVARVASLQFGAAGLATRDESAVATEAATAASAITAETATTMAFLINMPSFGSPRSGYSRLDDEAPRELSRTASTTSACPRSPGECDTSPVTCQQPGRLARGICQSVDP